MATYSKQFLSGSTDGEPIPVGATTSPGDVIHTCQANSNIDEVTLYAASMASGDVDLTLEIGGTGVTAQSKVSIAPGSGQVLVLAGIPLKNGLGVKAFASQAGVVSIWGFVNRIS